ncbi:unnamed protein product [Adineta ricciae]|uniref:Reelin domain-containing protein n=1 Tax=Adineta ricciae TaxID=249248 RepID=A0A816DC05_ADIRI|nr:unnamed protein product [Adineta ricciae]CAF1635347.1 unnamed protein product [Adineta ricciae]
MLTRCITALAFVILIHFVSRISGHAYFIYPIPRNVYCANSSCTSNGTLGAQGPVWTLPSNSTLSMTSVTSQTSCNGSSLLISAPLGNTYDSGFNGNTSVSWSAGSLQTLQIFISEIHSPENQTIYPTDGWQILYRDGTIPNSTFAPISFLYVNVSTTSSIGPAPAIGFQVGQIVQAQITVPSVATTDGIFQFFWRNNEVGPGVMWLSCADVTITATALATIPTPSVLSIFFTAFVFVFSASINI